MNDKTIQSELFDEVYKVMDQYGIDFPVAKEAVKKSYPDPKIQALVEQL